MGTEEQWIQRISGYRGSVGTEKQWVLRDRGTVSTEEQGVQRSSGYRGTVGTEEQRNTGLSGTAVKFDKTNTKVVIYRIRAHQNNLPILQLKCEIH